MFKVIEKAFSEKVCPEYSIQNTCCLSFYVIMKHMGLDARKLVFGDLRKNTGADQPAHPRSLISAFVIRFLASFICKLATSEISNF